MRRIKYPISQAARIATGGKTPVYAMVLALEEWAVAHGYKGYRRILRRTKAQKALQTRIIFKGE